MESEEYMSGGTTLPDYINVRNIMLQQWEELNRATRVFRLSTLRNYKPALKSFQEAFIDFFGQVNDSSKLSHFKKHEREFITYFYYNPNKINKQVSFKINVLTRKLLKEYGIFDLEGGNRLDFA